MNRNTRRRAKEERKLERRLAKEREARQKKVSASVHMTPTNTYRDTTSKSSDVSRLLVSSQ